MEMPLAAIRQTESRAGTALDAGTEMPVRCRGRWPEMVHPELFPSCDDLSRVMQTRVEEVIASLPAPFTEAELEEALKGKCTGWNWSLTFQGNEADVEEAEEAVKAGKPVDVIIWAWIQGDGRRPAQTTRAMMIIPDRTKDVA